MLQIQGPSLPFLRAINDIITPDSGNPFLLNFFPIFIDTNYLIELVPQISLRFNLTIELTKALHEKMKNREPLFKSSKQLDWALEILGYGFVSSQQQYIKDDKNYLESILAIYDYLLCGQVELELEGELKEFRNIEVYENIVL